MMKIFSLIFVLLSISQTALAASYSLPSDLGRSPFNCTGSGPTYSCNNSISLSKESRITLSANVTLNISGNLSIDKEFRVRTNGYTFNLNVSGNVSIAKEAEFTGNITAGGNVSIDKEAEFVGDIVAGGNITVDKEGEFTGDLTAGGSLDLKKDTTVDGVCTPYHPQCTGGATNTCGINPVTQAGFGGDQIKIEDSATNNGIDMTNGTYSGNAVLDIGAATPATGNTTTLPDIEPSELPSNRSSNKQTMSNNETINSNSDVYYEEIKIKNHNTGSLTGGGPFHIKKLKIEDNATLNIEAGIYYIDDFEIKNRGKLNITSEPVLLYIGDDFKVKGDSIVTGTTIAGLRVYMLQDSNKAEFEDNSTFTGIVYAPYGADIELKNNVQVNAQLVTSGELKLKGDAELSFSTADLSAVSKVSTCQNAEVEEIDHFNIDVGAGSANTCTPFVFTITAEDSSNNTVTDYSGSITVSSNTSNGNFSTVTTTNSLSPNPDTDDNGSASYTFDALDDGAITLSLANEHAETMTFSVTDSSIPVTSTSANVTFSDNAFTITDTDTDLTGNDDIPVAGRNHPYQIQMIRKDPVNGCGVATGYTGLKNLKMWRTKSDPALSSNNPVLDGDSLPSIEPASANGSITFVSGVADVTLVTSDIGKFSIELEDISNTFADVTIAGSSNIQTVRPFGLAITSIYQGSTVNTGATIPSGDIFATAGTDFSATVQAVLWDNADDNDAGGNGDGEIDTGRSFNDNTKVPNFAWNTTLDVISGGFIPATGSAGDLLRNTNSTVTLSKAEFASGSNPSVGSYSVNDLRYTEVGSFTIQANSVNILSTSGINISSDNIIVGRFIPASFEVSSVIDGGFQDSCGSFTYIGQDFNFLTPPSFVVTAKNALSATTTKYTGSWSKLTTASFSISTETADATNALDVVHTPSIPGLTPIIGSDGSFNVTLGSDTFCYGLDTGTGCVKQVNSAIAEFSSDINIQLSSISDGDSVSTTINQEFDLAPNTMRFGRLRVDNVYGSELINLTMPMKTEYYNGTNFITNQNDNCSVVDNANLIQTDTLTGGSSSASVSNSTAINGEWDITLTAPGAGNTGNVTITPDLDSLTEPWLKFDWDGDTNHDNNPSAQATFGIYNGDDRQIYYRQIYR